MAFAAKVLTDSVSELGDRLVTFEVTFPRIVLSEFNTHCMLARNSASSRAIPVLKRIRAVLEEPFVPEEFGTNMPGMQASVPLTGELDAEAREVWLAGRDRAVVTALELTFGKGFVAGQPTFAQLTEIVGKLGADDVKAAKLGVHKQIVNRVLEPYMWHTVVTTATDWSNFFALRTHEAAQPEIRRAANLMLDALRASTPKPVPAGGWHLPFVDPEEQANSGKDELYWAGISAARCARVSYLTHDGRRSLEADEQLHDRLRNAGHLSPFEHPGRAMTAAEKAANPRSGKFYGWHQFRKDLPHESNYGEVINFHI
ncbi:MAG: FAD-dependent thymidylate synthase [Propionibacteriaceae bacterium]|jgi:hypothetical protein|nr:FAD-dependent thymidylate synthase [Propionibacteriaceae bacterium]